MLLRGAQIGVTAC